MQSGQAKQLKSNLELLGFTGNETDVYLALIAGKRLKAADVVKKSKLHRSAVYLALDSLVEKGYVFKDDSGTGAAEFFIISPRVLVERQQEKLSASQQSAYEIMQLLKPSGDAGSHTIITGERAFKQAVNAMMDSMPDGGKIFFLHDSVLDIQARMANFWKQFHMRRLTRNIHVRMLYEPRFGDVVIESSNRLPDCEALRLAEPLLPGWVMITDSWMLQTVSLYDPVRALLIHDPGYVQHVIEYFHVMWERANR